MLLKVGNNIPSLNFEITQTLLGKIEYSESYREQYLNQDSTDAFVRDLRQ